MTWCSLKCKQDLNMFFKTVFRQSRGSQIFTTFIWKQ